MTGSFLFVKPSNSKGEHGTVYSGDSPRYPYDHASWEWLLERALRRTLLPWALTTSHSQVILYGHEDQYSMHKWGSYGESDYAASTPTAYQGVGGPGSTSRKTDADLSEGDRSTWLPISWNSSTEVPKYMSTKVAYGIVDLENKVARLPFSLEWLHPGWKDSALSEWDLTATTTETTEGSASAEDAWTWKTDVEHGSYDIPSEPPFKCLSHMRTDDDPVNVGITNDDGEGVTIETAPTPAAAPRKLEGSIREYDGTQVRIALDGAAYGAGWTLSEFYIPYRHGLDFSQSTGSLAYDRGDKTVSALQGASSPLGCPVDLPDKGSGNILISYPNRGGNAKVVHEVDWDGKPTWWHANDFPKGLDYVISSKLKEQLKDLCPKCQPAIAPAIPALWEKFPDAGRLPWDYSKSTPSSLDSNTYPQGWMRHLSLACTPIDMAARLDAMTMTVHRVPHLFAKIKTVDVRYSTTYEKRSDSGGGQSWYRESFRNETQVEGASTDPIPTGGDLGSLSGQVSSVRTSRTSNIHYEDGETSSSLTAKTTLEESFESNVDFLVCLRSTSNTTPSTKTTTKTSTEYDYSDYGPTESETESSYGEVPESYDPDPDDLLFPDWVLPWIKTAELFASIESRLVRKHLTTDLDTYYYKETPGNGSGGDTTPTVTYDGRGSGTRTHEVHRKIVSLGKMDLSTGRFPKVDVTEILSDVDPDPTCITKWISDWWKTTSRNITTNYDKDGSWTQEVVESHKDPISSASRSRSVSYYVVVEWKFDRTDPKTLKTDSPLAGLYRKLADANTALAEKESELSAAETTLADAEYYLTSAESALEKAQEQLNDPESAAPELFAAAEAEITRTKDELSEAEKDKAKAEREADLAKKAMQEAKSKLQEAQAEYDAAVAAGEGVDEAGAALEGAYGVYYNAVGKQNEASGDLTEAKVAEEIARKDADAAQEYYDSLLEDITGVIQKMFDDAKEAVDKAHLMVEEWEQKVDEIKEEIERLKENVKNAEQAIRDAVNNII